MSEVKNTILDAPIEYLKGVGPLRGDMLRKELHIFSFKDLLHYFPYKHIDKTAITPIAQLVTFANAYAQVSGQIIHKEIVGEKHNKRLVALLKDSSGILELTWFRGVQWMNKWIEPGKQYLVYGKVGFFHNKPQIAHPEIEPVNTQQPQAHFHLQPVYNTTEKLSMKGLNGRQIGKLTHTLLLQLSENDIPENLPSCIVNKLQLISRFHAFQYIHFPSSQKQYEAALKRLKFEELFLFQVRLQLKRRQRMQAGKGVVFEKVGDYFQTFFQQFLPFELTQAQKKVMKEIRRDVKSGYQMNRLLQGDVGSGKTVVALLSMLLAADNGFQSCLMAPTEILAQQHFNTINDLLKNMLLPIALLTGSVKEKERKKINAQLQEGNLQILVGTHALIEETVRFQNLGLAVIDEQHRFGVAQRAKLWSKAATPPHILVMTATPIPRTLAMTAYGDLDYSVLNELPPGRQPVTTVHRYEQHRAFVMEFIKTETQKGRQAYIIYPLIEESEKLSYQNLMEGYEQVKSFFPEPTYRISMVHGRQSPQEKAVNMQRFVSGHTQIMVSTTVIEVGVNVPNASVMVIESAEKFGLSQLHQLRGRVGRGNYKSYCILLSSSNLNKEAKERINIMCATNDGFVIAEKDLMLRGPGNIEGTQQSGIVPFKLASIVEDKGLLELAKKEAEAIVEADSQLEKKENELLRKFLFHQKEKTHWSKIS